MVYFGGSPSSPKEAGRTCVIPARHPARASEWSPMEPHSSARTLRAQRGRMDGSSGGRWRAKGAEIWTYDAGSVCTIRIRTVYPGGHPRGRVEIRCGCVLARADLEGTFNLCPPVCLYPYYAWEVFVLEPRALTRRRKKKTALCAASLSSAPIEKPMKMQWLSRYVLVQHAMSGRVPTWYQYYQCSTPLRTFRLMCLRICTNTP